LRNSIVYPQFYA